MPTVFHCRLCGGGKYTNAIHSTQTLKSFWSQAPERSSAPKESRCRLSFCIRGESCFLSILKTGTGGPSVQLGSSFFLAALYQAVTYLDLKTSFVKTKLRHRRDVTLEVGPSDCQTKLEKTKPIVKHGISRNGPIWLKFRFWEKGGHFCLGRTFLTLQPLPKQFRHVRMTAQDTGKVLGGWNSSLTPNT